MKQVKIKDPGFKNIIQKYDTTFVGLCKLKDKQIKLCIDKEITPVPQQQRRVTFHLQEKVEQEVRNLQSQDIIEKVLDTEQTDWISPIVIVTKNEGKIRLCVDMRAASTAIKRTRHPIEYLL